MTTAIDASAVLVTRNPATGLTTASYPVADSAVLRAAVDAARVAGEWWRSLGWKQRRRHLSALRLALAREIDDVAAMIRAETGKPLDDAVLEVMLAAEHLDWAARNARRVLRPRRVRPGLLAVNQKAVLEYVPLGVVGVIGPWNYPLYTPMGSISYALAAGNAVVFKPSEYAPGVGRWLADTWARVVPDHPVLQVVTGFGATGAALCESGVDKIAFTGSTATGRRVMAACASTLTPVVIEAGGKDALIVAADADLDAAATAAVFGGMGNAGQTCAGVERIFVVDSVFDDFLARVTTLATCLRTGEDEGTHYGPITMPGQVEVIRAHIEDALGRGARAVVGGADSVRPPFVAPVVLVDVPSDSLAAREETFGPTLVVDRVADLDEAVRRANDSRFGLAASVFTRNRKHGIDAARRLHTGAVSVNSVLGFASIPALPFGGVGDSGFGRIHGADGLREFSRPKAITSTRFASPVDLMTLERSPKAVPNALFLFRLRHGHR
ncbi:aldehyde dehydrogenase [Parafrankia colletiae]|uniref:Aldehyde dehydrogenase n=1 Tax=Parafrankia colletiae TaxID=573497 RepID=A0A1S1Q9R2_9ACTN|nr:aldehyde dehydrogenase family protein [Parafrankia colletiae]MCK9903329.1 aldehyde dehydrogenase family protein [Frankia sp. Cpl3]OHV29842.1 aldehyde dehydrogenase [Parafrankia colletiae]